MICTHLLGVAGVFCIGSAAAAGDVVDARLNGLTVSVDTTTGGIRALAFPGPGRMLETPRDQAGLVDLACPVPEFEPLRLAPRHSTGARIDVAEGRLTITWDALGASRAFETGGPVSVTATFEALPDGRSVALSCRVTNGSGRAIPQVLFPDLDGLVPFAGVSATQFRSCGNLTHPFSDLRNPPWDQFYAQDSSYAEYQSGGLFHSMVGRWFDVGGRTGGLSVFPRLWGWDAHDTVMLHLSQATGRLRLSCEHRDAIAPGATWDSPAYVLTPHSRGWASGIGPYREWVRLNTHRVRPLPSHVREGLGYRTVWMCQNQPADPQDAVWRFSDLPALALEARKNGLDELMLWAWNRGFVLPLPGPYAHLGTEQELVEAVAECRALGVNVSLFISVLQADKDTASRYGLTVTPGSGNWTYNTELVPRFAPYYAAGLACVQVDPGNEKWQADVLASCKRLIDAGMPSIGWDQFWATQGPRNMHTLAADIVRSLAAADPEATFSGEELWNFELDSDYLDYTWNWNWPGYQNCEALLSAFSAPRVNVHVNTNPASVKWAFANNLYMNVWPSRPDNINGSARVGDYPELSAALQQCAELRKRFLRYFTEGTLIGDCAPTGDPPPGVFVATYVLGDRALTIVLNREARTRVPLELDISPWLGRDPSRCTVRTYSDAGRLVSEADVQGHRWPVTAELDHLGMALYECVVK